MDISKTDYTLLRRLLKDLSLGVYMVDSSLTVKQRNLLRRVLLLHKKYERRDDRLRRSKKL